VYLEVLSEWLRLYLDPYEPILKLISFVIGPLLAVVALWWNRRDRRRMLTQAEALGTARAQSEQAREEADQRRREVDAARHELETKGAQVAKLERDLRSITEGSQELWKLREAQAFPEYAFWPLRTEGAKIITIGNLKGGVGKTTLAANLAAYISETLKKRALLIDLDYQGSLSNMLLLAIGEEQVDSRIDRLFAADADFATLEAAKIHLADKICRAWLVPANYTFAQLENQLLLKWLLRDDENLDVRYRLAKVLLHPSVRRNYDAIILDMPPRMTLGSINALVASHAFVVPTILDSLSVEAVSQFLSNMKAIKKDLSLTIELAGIVGMMTRQEKPSEVERRALALATESGFIWKENRDYIFKATLPRKVDIANAAGEDIAYFGSDGQGPLRRFFDPLFEEICTAVWKGDGP
jgi:chromosome partitioning protein